MDNVEDCRHEVKLYDVGFLAQAQPRTPARHSNDGIYHLRHIPVPQEDFLQHFGHASCIGAAMAYIVVHTW